jgi:hypothetical protein
MALVGRDPSYTADLSSAGLTAYTPKIYSKKLLIAFYAKTVFGEISQRDYEGEINSQGDTVVIRTRPTPVIGKYTKGMDLNAVRQFLAPPAMELQITEADFFSIGIDALDEAQNDINALDEWATDTSEAMGNVVDTAVLNNLYTSVDADNTGLTAGAKSHGYNIGTATAATAVSLTKANILDYISYCASILTEQNVPADGNRWMVMPEIFISRINTSDLRSALFTGDQSNQNLRNGRVGEIAGFKIYSSNNVNQIAAQAGVFPIQFGHKLGITFASQLIKNRTIELQNTFGRAMEGLQVYGFKVVKPEAVGCMYAKAG